jgi:hypothetical protein
LLTIRLPIALQHALQFALQINLHESPACVAGVSLCVQAMQMNTLAGELRGNCGDMHLSANDFMYPFLC